MEYIEFNKHIMRGWVSHSAVVKMPNYWASCDFNRGVVHCRVKGELSVFHRNVWNPCWQRCLSTNSWNSPRKSTAWRRTFSQRIRDNVIKLNIFQSPVRLFLLASCDLAFNNVHRRDGKKHWWWCGWGRVAVWRWDSFSHHQPGFSNYVSTWLLLYFLLSFTSRKKLPKSVSVISVIGG